MKPTLLNCTAALLMLLSWGGATPARAQHTPLAPAPIRAGDAFGDSRARLLAELDQANTRLTALRRAQADALRANNLAEVDRLNAEAATLDATIRQLRAQTTGESTTFGPSRTVEIAPPGAVIPVDVRPAESMTRLPLRAAQEELQKLEEARQAETALARRGQRIEPESTARTQLRSMQAEAARLDEAATATARTLATSSNPAEIQQELDRLNSRKAQLEQDLERWRADVERVEAQKRQLRDELARLDMDNQASTQLLSVQGELNRIAGDIAAAQQALQNARAVTLARPPEPVFSPRGETGGPAFVGSTTPRSATRRPSSFATGDEDPRGAVRRTVSRPSAQAQREMERAQEQKEKLQRDIDRLQLALPLANRELALAMRVGNQVEIDKANKRVGDIEAELRAAQVELGKLDDTLQARMRGFQTTVTQPSPLDAIQPFDHLNVTVAQDDSFNGIFQVKSGGYILLPRIGRVPVGGKTVAEAESLLKSSLESSQLVTATVMIERTRPEVPMEEPDSERPSPFRDPQWDPNQITRAPTEQFDVIFLAGEFNLPGPLRVPTGVKPTLLTIVLRSGGVTPSADLQRVRLLRFGQNGSRGQVEEFNLQAVLQGTGTPVDVELRANDVIFVPGHTPVVYVTGNVVRPGALRLFQDEPITAYSAILRSGGFSRFANTKKVRVVRELGNGEKASIPINIKDIQEGKQPDVILQGRDVVFVPEAFFSW